MKSNFKEALLKDFYPSKIKEVKELIYSSTSFSIVGMPAMGISMFLKYLATQNFAYFIHIDINDLSNLNKIEFFKLLFFEISGQKIDYPISIESCQKELSNILKKEKRVVLIFNRFDKLEKEFTRDFFANLRSLRDLDKEKIVMVFAANKSLISAFPEAVKGGNLNMYSKTVYLKPFLPRDLLKLLNLNTPNLKLSKKVIQKAIEFSGGHYQFFQLLLKSEKLLESPISDPAIKIQLKEMFEFLNYPQRKQLQKIAIGRSLSNIDPELLNLGFVNLGPNNQYSIFTPLMSDYIKSTLRMKLAAKEQKLFKLLKENEGKVVLKDQIFENLWLNNEDTASDWALNALIYRLRKNPSFQSSGYIIESHKKIGYSLLKI